jgi:hypothetical protein
VAGRSLGCPVHSFTMPRGRWFILAGLSALIAVGVALALLSWKWHGELATPAGQATQTVVFDCSAPWGADTVRGPTETTYAIIGRPCGERHVYRVITVVDVILGVIGVAVVTNWGRIRFAEPTPS